MAHDAVEKLVVNEWLEVPLMTLMGSVMKLWAAYIVMGKLRIPSGSVVGKLVVVVHVELELALTKNHSGWCLPEVKKSARRTR